MLGLAYASLKQTFGDLWYAVVAVVFVIVLRIVAEVLDRRSS
jgi:hypothetical protein